MTVTTADIGAARVITWDRQARRNAWDLPTMTADRRRDRGGRPRRGRSHGRGARSRRALLGGGRPAGGDRGRHRRMGGDDRGLPADDARGPGRAGAGGGRGGRRVRGRRARVRRELRPPALQQPRAPAHPGGRNRTGREQRGDAPAAGGARRERRSGASAQRGGARRRMGAGARLRHRARGSAGARQAHRALGGDLLADVARRGGGHEGDAERALRRAAARRDGPRDATTACACSTNRTPAPR